MNIFNLEYFKKKKWKSIRNLLTELNLKYFNFVLR